MSNKRRPAPFGGFRIICPHCKKSKSVILDATISGSPLMTIGIPFIICEACEYEWNPRMVPGKRKLPT